MKPIILSIVLSVASLTGGIFRASGAEPSRNESELAIRAVLDSQAIAWNKGDLIAFMAGYWKSKELTFYSGKDKRLGWEETLDRYKKRYQADGKEMGQLTFAELEIQYDRPRPRGREGALAGGNEKRKARRPFYPHHEEDREGMEDYPRSYVVGIGLTLSRFTRSYGPGP